MCKITQKDEESLSSPVSNKITDAVLKILL
jgi:hypothetical protein